MRYKYQKPEIIIENLLKEDVLMSSVETDNNYVRSEDLVDKFSVEGLL